MTIISPVKLESLGDNEKDFLCIIIDKYIDKNNSRLKEVTIIKMNFKF